MNCSRIYSGGPAGLIYSYIYVWIGTICIFTSLSELSSMAPTAGGQYHWVSMLAPPWCQRFLSYVTGWLTVCGWQGVIASTLYVTAALIQGVVILTIPSYDPKPWHATLMFWAALALVVFVNTGMSRSLPVFEGCILIIHILGFFAIMIPLVTLGPHKDASEVFSQFLNQGEWQSQGLSFMIGVTGTIWCFIGWDGAIHMSEEIRNAALVTPHSILFSIFLNGVLGFGMLIATLFCLGDVQAALDSPTGYPFMEIFLQATKSVSGAAIMSCIIVVMQICADVGCFTATSRMTWSFARDRGLPGWRTLQKVDPRTSIPLWSIGLTTVVNLLLSLINLGSSVAFNDVVSLGIAGLYSSYLIASTLLLYRRCMGHIASSANADVKLVNTVGAKLVWGPWHIPGALGIATNAYACIYMTVSLFFAFWPTENPATPENMNYASLVLGAVIIFSIVYYYAGGKKDYTGPVIEVEGTIKN